MFLEARSCAKTYLEFYLGGNGSLNASGKGRRRSSRMFFFLLLTCEGGDAKTAAAAFGTDEGESRRIVKFPLDPSLLLLSALQEL